MPVIDLAVFKKIQLFQLKHTIDLLNFSQIWSTIGSNWYLLV